MSPELSLSYKIVYASSEDSDQTVHQCSLISNNSAVCG